MECEESFAPTPPKMTPYRTGRLPPHEDLEGIRSLTSYGHRNYRLARLMRQWVGWSCMVGLSWNFGRRPMDGKRHRFVPGADCWRAPPLPSLSMVCLSFRSLGRSWPKLPSIETGPFVQFPITNPLLSFKSFFLSCHFTKCPGIRFEKLSFYKPYCSRWH